MPWTEDAGGAEAKRVCLTCQNGMGRVKKSLEKQSETPGLAVLCVLRVLIILERSDGIAWPCPKAVK